MTSKWLRAFSSIDTRVESMNMTSRRSIVTVSPGHAPGGDEPSERFGSGSRVDLAA